MDGRILRNQRANLVTLEAALAPLDEELAARIDGLWTRLDALEQRLADVSANTLPAALEAAA
jgi:hypothetical protein